MGTVYFICNEFLKSISFQVITQKNPPTPDVCSSEFPTIVTPSTTHILNLTSPTTCECPQRTQEHPEFELQQTQVGILDFIKLKYEY